MKKHIVLCGTIEVPLTKGCFAFLRKEGGEPFRTTAVKRYFAIPFGFAHIETENTHYYLHPPARRPAERRVRR